ncbi:DNA/RNA helicase domain-containing protein [Streptomyces sp. 8N616]|uniref:DNA/RNA helicase domain-containing protein n=1 Tax=Streptomyces sp. 8N616 TaxID=3457414 RepID=UPI003FD3A4D0
MTLLRISARSLAEDGIAEPRTYVASLINQYSFTYRRNPSRAEVRSWEQSLYALARLLVDAQLGDVEMLIEYQLPMCSLRADVVLAGVHPSTHDPSYVVIELKQWSAASVISGANDLCEVPGLRPRRALLHPVTQVRRYCEYLIDFTKVLDGHEERVSSAAYLHNADEDHVRSLLTLPQDRRGRLFTRTTRDAFEQFLKERIKRDPHDRAGDSLARSRMAPSRKLMALAADEVLSRRHFKLIGAQQTAFSLVLRTLGKARAAGGGSSNKEVVVITGGPGSGKSVIALSLMGELSRSKTRVVHATGSKSFTTTLRKEIARQSSGVAKLFSYFNNFEKARPNDLEVLICDEAHRIRETTNGAPAGSRWAARRQIDELIDAAQVPVFLLDQHQVVRPGETGTVAVIEEAARHRNIPVRHVDLDVQFRCGGSRAYETWVLRLLGLEKGGPVEWAGDDRFLVEIAESPAELEEILRAKRAEGRTARIAAGYCWPWSDPLTDGTLVDDVQIGSWQRPWNIRAPAGVKGLPSSDLWATDPGGFGQVGCVYTAQGFEYDWNGVIVGPDLVWRPGGWQTDPSASEDPALSDASPGDFDRLIRNTYKVLLTRGMVGTVLYSTDERTQKMLRALVRPKVHTKSHMDQTDSASALG